VVGFGGHGDEVSDVVEVVAFKAAKDPSITSMARLLI